MPPASRSDIPDAELPFASPHDLTGLRGAFTIEEFEKQVAPYLKG